MFYIFKTLFNLKQMPNFVQQQQLKWSVQWSLRIPPSATPIVPIGQAAILVCRNKILFFVSCSFLYHPPSLSKILIYLTFVFYLLTAANNASWCSIRKRYRTSIISSSLGIRRQHKFDTAGGEEGSWTCDSNDCCKHATKEICGVVVES